MATLTSRGETWYLNWTDPHTTKRERRKIGSKRIVSEGDARAALLKLEYELAYSDPALAGRRSANHGITVTWADLSAQYLTWYRTHFPASYERTEITVKKHLDPFFTTKPLALLTQGNGEDYVVHRTKYVAPSTALKELRTLKAMLTKGVQWKLVTANPMSLVAAPPDLRSAPVEFYSLDELRSLYSRSTTRNGAIWKLFANTGMRRAEALSLRWNEVSDNTITVISTASRRTKSKKWRVIPISPGARDALDVLGASGRDGYVLPRLAPHSLTRLFDRDATRARLGGSLHTLRHTFASHLVMAGRPLYEVKALLGHASIKTTEIYAHLAPGHLQESVKGLNL